MKIVYSIISFLFLLSAPALAREVPDFRCEVYLSENNEDILTHWDALHNALRLNPYLQLCFTEADVQVVQKGEGYNFIVRQPTMRVYQSLEGDDKSLLTLKMQEDDLIIQTQIQEEKLYIKIYTNKVIDTELYMDSKVINVKAEISGEAIYDQNIQTYTDVNWKINNLQMNMLYDFTGGQTHIFVDEIQGKTDLIEPVISSKVNLSHDIVFQDVKFYHLRFNPDVFGEHLGNMNMIKLMIKELTQKQEYKQTDQDFWMNNISCFSGAESFSLATCFFEKIKDKNIGEIKNIFDVKEVSLKIYSLENTLIEADFERITSRLRLKENNQELEASYHLSSLNNRYGKYNLQDQFPIEILPHALSYRFSFSGLQKSQIDEAKSWNEIDVTGIAVFIEAYFKALDNMALDFQAKVLGSKKANWILQDLLQGRGDLLDNMEGSQIELNLKLTEQSKIVATLAPLLPIGKNIINLVLAMYGKKIEAKPPQHSYKLTIEEGQPKINGKSLGWRF